MTTDETRERPKGICAHCRRPHRLRKTGTVGMHHRLTQQGYNTGSVCPGVDQPPAEPESTR